MTYEELLCAVKKEFPGFRVVHKRDSWFMWGLSLLLFFNPQFMTHFVTTIGNYMWVPDVWCEWREEVKLEVLRHERVHLRQQKRLTFPIYALVYLLFPLPVWCCYGRTWLEMEAYEESMRAVSEYHGSDVLDTEAYRGIMVYRFTSGEYAWMMAANPKWVRRWYDETAKKIQASLPT